MSGFRIDQPFLKQMLKDIGEGKIQLPDFQRGWVWDDERIQSLIASVSQEFPIGSVLILNPTDTDVLFIPRLVKGSILTMLIQILILLFWMDNKG